MAEVTIKNINFGKNHFIKNSGRHHWTHLFYCGDMTKADLMKELDYVFF